MSKFLPILMTVFLFPLFVFAEGGDSLATHYDTIAISVCENRFPVYYDGEKYDTVGLYFVKKEDTAYYISIGAYLLYNDTIYDTIRRGTEYDKNGFCVTQEGFYTRKLRNINGCDSVVTLRLTVWDKPNIVFPNAFTPNGPTNNVFAYWVSDTANIQIETFEIFDRWGTRVFRTDKLNDFWDGTFKGKLCLSDIYTYRIFYRYKFTKRILYQQNGNLLLVY